MTLEVGVVYRGGLCYYLALPSGRVLSFRHGVPVVATPPARRRLSPTRGVPVEDVCEAWGVAVRDLDAIVREHLSPETAGVEAVRLRSRGARDAEDWRERRTFRVSPQARGILGGQS